MNEKEARDPKVTETECLILVRTLSRRTTHLKAIPLFHERVSLVGRLRTLYMDIIEEGETDKAAIAAKMEERIKADPQMGPLLTLIATQLLTKLIIEIVERLWERWHSKEINDASNFT